MVKLSTKSVICSLILFSTLTLYIPRYIPPENILLWANKATSQTSLFSSTLPSSSTVFVEREPKLPSHTSVSLLMVSFTYIIEILEYHVT